MPTLVVDGQTVTVPEGATVLQAVRQAGARLSTLCYWEGLPGYGACRLCLVELRPAGQVVAACTQPAAEGLVVETQGERAAAARRLMLEFMLGRCPESPVIRDLAVEAGLSNSRFSGRMPDADAHEKCILCGLCVRVCRDLVGATAIGFVGRGPERMVGTPFLVQAETCIGCGACAVVCPTGAIQIEDVDGRRMLRTWNTVVDLRPCPGCGQSYAPEPMAFLRKIPGAEAGEDLWDLCPTCRRKRAAARFDFALKARA